MLENVIEPLITEIMEENPNEFVIEITFQQDGAPLYYDSYARNYLDNNFCDFWIDLGSQEMACFCLRLFECWI